MDFNEAKELFFGNMRRVSNMRSAGALLFWDMLTVMPKKGAEARARVLGSIESEAFRLSTSKEYGDAIERLAAFLDKLSPRERRMVEEAGFEYKRFKKIPTDMYEAYSALKATSGHFWQQAKLSDNYEIFKPYLKKKIEYSRELAELWGYNDNPYDAMLEGSDPDMLTARLDQIFAELLSGTRDLLSRVSKDKNVVLPAVNASDDKQFKAGQYLLSAIGYDLEAGSLYTTEHPFSTAIHSNDVRVTTKYHNDAPLSSVFSVLHEGGHGIYDMNISAELDGTNLMDGASMGMHESQSRFFENILGRSQAFWNAHLSKIEDILGVRLAKDANEFYRGINAVKPSLIRIEADELTYNLHIIIRYECEKAIFNEGIGVNELPELWREKYREYLGVVPETYSEGMLQDVHWADADFGYFPSYTIGNLCAAQFADAFEKRHGPIEKHAGSAEGMALIVSWLNENIHKYGKEEKPEQIMRRVCGENINPSYFLKYIGEKLSRVYALPYAD